MHRPDPSEYVAYYDTYIKLVPDGEISSILKDQIEATLGILRNLNEEQAVFRYAPDKWTVKQVIGHLIDCERAFAYRAPCALPGMIQPAFPQLTRILSWKIVITMSDLCKIL